MMPNEEIAERLHRMVDSWLEIARDEPEMCVVLRIRWARPDDSDSVALIVGTEPIISTTTDD